MWISKKEYEKMNNLAEGRKHNLKDLNKQIAKLKQLDATTNKVMEIDNRLIAAQRELITYLMKTISYLESKNETIHPPNQ